MPGELLQMDKHLRKHRNLYKLPDQLHKYHLLKLHQPDTQVHKHRKQYNLL